MKNILRNSIMFASALVAIFIISSNIASAAAPTITTNAASSVTQTTATLNGTFSGSPTNTSFEWGTTSGQVSSGSGISVGSATQTLPSGNFNFNLTGLTAGTTYYFQTVGLNNDGPANGSVLSFTTSPILSINQPTITTNNASSITQTATTLNGTFSGSPDNTWFEYGTTSGQVSSGSGIIVGQNTQSSTSGNFNFNLTGLIAGTTYYFQAVGSNNGGPANGLVLSFTTLSSGVTPPAIITNNASAINQTTVTLNGTFSGLPANTWFEYGTTSGQVSSGSGIIIGQANQTLPSGTFTFNLTGLSNNTTYYFQAVGSNNGGPANGSILLFTTSTPPSTYIPPSGGCSNGCGGRYFPPSNSNPPVIITNGSVNKLNVVTSLTTIITKTSTKINGIAINTNSGTESWFNYGKSINLNQSTPVRNIVDATSIPLYEILTDLDPDTIYFYRLNARNQAGVVQGEIKIFKTLPASDITPSLTPYLSTSISTTDGIQSSADNTQLVSLKIESDLNTAKPGDDINYKITYKNISQKNIKNTILKVSLPSKAEFINVSNGDFNATDKIVTADLGEISPNSDGLVYIKEKVVSDVKDKDILIASASVIYTDKESGAQKDITDYSLININNTGNNLAAASIFGNYSSLLPSTLVGWLFLLLIIVAIIMFGKKIYSTSGKNTIMNVFKK